MNYYDQHPNNYQYQQQQPPQQQSPNINYNVSPVQEESLDLEQIIRKIKPTLSNSSIRIYTTNLSKLYKFVNNTYDNNIENLDFIYNKKRIDKFLSDKALKTKANYYTNILTLYKYIIDIEENQDSKIQKLYYDFEKQKQAYNFEIKQATAKREHSQQKQDKIISLKLYFQFLNSLKKGNRQDFVLFYFLYHLPFRNEIATLKIVYRDIYEKQYHTKELRQSKTKEYKNIIVHDANGEKIYIFRNDYKTYKTYGEIISTIDKEENPKFYKILSSWINHRGTADNLFSKKGGKSQEQFTGSDLSSHLGYISRDYLQVKLTTASIFKMVIANYEGGPADMLDFIEEKGKERGTSVNTLINFYVYKKNVDLDNVDTDE